MRKASYSSLIIVNVDGEEHNTLVRDFQMDYILGNLTHVDFLVVSLTEKVRTEVRVIVEGKAPVVVNSGGLLVTGLDSVEVESLPQDLPDHFVVDVSSMEEFGNAIFVRDLVVPENVDILTDPDELLVVATAPAAEEAPEVEEAAEGEVAEGEPAATEAGAADEADGEESE
jgi:large subunit ribosomal protein L25